MSNNLIATKDHDCSGAAFHRGSRIEIIDIDDEAAIIKNYSGEEQLVGKADVVVFDELSVIEQIKFLFSRLKDFTVVFSKRSIYGGCVERTREFKMVGVRKPIYGAVFSKQRSRGGRYIAQVELADEAVGLCTGTHKITYGRRGCHIVRC
jgi:hypothetical protein